ncbi:hypothetical protein NLG97_g9264 [Lecanicillium saksenae]|uniref:Uncharacterized protein n=1 Tax=Lecanicillium saksenae TaxID=468837 RepID=A0ACC1QI73_9HYPO|nr:hypothetical protein NLG97_g9264 [Lecanicillium saksenae]
MKFFTTALLLLITEAVATRVAYSMGFTEGGVEGKGGVTTKNGKKPIPDDKEESLIEHMGNWSDNKFKATKSTSGVNLVTITNVHKPKHSSEAKDQLEEAQKIVNKHMK